MDSFSSESGFKRTEGYVPVKDGRLFYQVCGEGVPILVVHGGPGMDQTYLQPQLFELAEDYQLIFYDQRGSGRSLQTVDDTSNFTMERFVLDIEVLRKHLGLNEFVLMGHSWGGFLSMHYASRYEQYLSGLVLLNTASANYEGQKAFLDMFAGRTEGIKDAIAPFFSSEAFMQLSAKEISDLYRKLISVYFYDESKHKSLNLEYELESARSGFRVKEALSTEWMVPGVDLFPQLKALKVPTLIVHGEQDIVPLWTIKEVNAAIEGSELVVLADCDHFPHIEKLDELKAAVGGFINRL